MCEEIKKLRRVHAQKTSLNHVFDFEKYKKQATIRPERRMADNQKCVLDDKSTTGK